MSLELNQNTQLALARLQDAEFFSHVGEQNALDNRVVGSWAAAMEIAQTQDWENLRLAAQNLLRDRVSAMSKERRAMWNDHADTTDSGLKKLVDEKVRRRIDSGELPEGLDIEVDYDLGNLLLEMEFSDIVKPGFFYGLSYWYEQGRFPCGWDGDWPPGGSLVVY